jgi:hypothetical protein
MNTSPQYAELIAAIRAETSSAAQARMIGRILVELRGVAPDHKVRDVLQEAADEVFFYATCFAEEEANEEHQHDERQKRSR